MDYSILDGNIKVNNLSEFNPKHIIESGQVFRYTLENNVYKIFSQNKCCRLISEKDCVTIETNNIDYFANYFDLTRNYSEIKQNLKKFSKLKNAIEFGSGLRILNQDIEETIISFIISANNNIPRIKGIIEKLCFHLGENMGDYFAFPTIDVLANQTESFYKSVGLGYRASYILKTALAIKSGFDLNLHGMATEDARAHIMKLSGVGPKVADCILLFAYHKSDSFPVDTWMEKVYINLFGKDGATRLQMSKRLTETFKNLSGYAQQYLFYYTRETSV